ncbi:MAG: acetyltransferase with multiple hexapeptide repeat domain [Daejeonella sp.]|nr:acetyltransferase with multiple hexapeptide repeat domain [Daejeonella sp.]
MMNLFFRLIFRLERLVHAERVKRLKRLLKYCGENVFIDRSCHILVPQQLQIGDNTSISSYCTIYAAFGVYIGKNCLISSNCGISSINHIQNSLIRHVDDENINYSKPVYIGNNVWVGMNACILPGVHIGENSIIGSGSVVTKNVPANEIWVGNPARFVRKINILENEVAENSITC